MSFTISGYKSIPSRIIGLLLGSRPYDIARFVVTIAVHALKAVFGTGTITYILLEQRKIVPPIAKRNSLFTIKMGIGYVGIQAACAHAFPQTVKRVFLHTVGCITRYRFFVLQASARSAISIQQEIVGNGFPVATVTSAKPVILTAFNVTHIAKDKPSFNFLTRKIFDLRAMIGVYV